LNPEEQNTIEQYVNPEEQSTKEHNETVHKYIICVS